MKKYFHLMSLSLSTMLLSHSAFAAEYLPLEQSATVCIPHANFQLGDVTDAISENYLIPACESKGGIVSLKRLRINHTGHGCPYGHQFQYELKGQCYIPQQ